MDSLVRQAMQKWPSVPDCYGWLGLDSRGRWCLRDKAVQASGAFYSGRIECKGAVLSHQGLIEFIARNYGVDERGRWYFQNGPQRVFVELECTPWIWRIDQTFQVNSHTGQKVEILECLLDQGGKLYLLTNIGLGLVHTQDVYHFSTAIENGMWLPRIVHSDDLAAQYAYVVSPAEHQIVAESTSEKIHHSNCQSV